MTYTKPIILHYHLFKNAGTSVDKALQDVFGCSWCPLEGDKGALDHGEMEEFISGHPECIAISSHTLRLPLPQVEGRQVFPIIFIRHPIDRAASVYRFERKQDASTPGAMAAKEMSFKGYVRWRLDRGDNQLRNFQVSRLCPPPDRAATLEKAMETIDAFPFVGLVENYESSLEMYELLLRKDYPETKLTSVRLNATGNSEKPLSERVEEVTEQLGSELSERLLQANALDLALWSKLVFYHQAGGRYSGMYETFCAADPKLNYSIPIQDGAHS